MSQNLNGTLNAASTLLDQNRLNEAKLSLDQAGVLIAQAQIILGDLKGGYLNFKPAFRRVFSVS